MPIRDRPRPHRRVIIGRAIALTAAAIFAATQALAYIPGAVPTPLPAAIRLISWNGELIWIWGLAWLTASVLCVYDMAKGRTRYGLSLFAGVSFTWGLAYLVGWALAGFETRGWMSGVVYMASAALVFGLVYKITALHDMANPASTPEAGTGLPGGRTDDE